MSMRVLIADDDNVSRMVICNYLREWNFEAVQAKSGTEAMEILCGENPPRIAILDWMMPGKSGVEICSYIENNFKHLVYCLLLTARSEKRDLTHALDNGAHQFLSKPIDPDILRSNLNVGKRLIETDDTLMRAEQIAAVGTLAEGIAHQYNNLNAGIIGYLDLLLYNNEIPDSGREIIKKIGGVCRRMKDMTDMMIAFVHTNEINTVDSLINDIADNALELEKDKLAEGGIKISVKFHPTSPMLLERNALVQAFLHLLINARHAVLGVENPEITISTGIKNKEQYFSVRDNGCGIAQEYQKQIFNPFFTLKGEHALPGSLQSKVRGYGLGLSVCDNIVRRHNGRIEFSSVPGGGSEFTIFLPNKHVY